MAGLSHRRVAATVGGALALTAVGLGPISAARSAPAAGSSYDSAVAEEARVTTRYGDSMAIELCFPAHAGVKAPGRFPVVGGLIYTGSAGSSPCASQLPYVQAGFIYAEIQVPGSAGSEGGPWDYADKDWALHNYDAIEWIAKQPWSTGKIGTIGGSGNGVSQLWTSQYRPPHLTTMIPQVSSHNGYDMQYPGGIRSLALVTLLCGIPGVLTTARNGIYGPPSNQEQLQEMLKIQEQKVTQLRGNPYCPPTYGAFAHPTYDSYWKDLNTSHIENVTIPVWVQGSWDDLFVNASQHDYLTFGSKNKMFSMGYVSHAFLLGSPGGFDATVQSIRWFDYWLKGIDNGIVDDLKNGRFQYQSWEEWKPKQAADYPIPGTKYTPYYLEGTSDSPLATGGLTTTLPTTQGSDSYVYNPASGALVSGPYSGFARAHNQAVESNRDTAAYLDPGGRGDQRIEQGGRLAYLGAPLTKDIEVTGPIHATIYATSTAEDTDFVVKLLDVEPDTPTGLDGKHAPPGFWHEVQPGYLKGTYRSYTSDYSTQTPIPVGKVVRYDIEVWPTSWYFRAGHRIGLSIASSDGLGAGPNTNPAQVTILHSAGFPSNITLPVIPRSATKYVTDGYMHTKKPATGSKVGGSRDASAARSLGPSSETVQSAPAVAATGRTAAAPARRHATSLTRMRLRLESVGKTINGNGTGASVLIALIARLGIGTARRRRMRSSG